MKVDIPYPVNVTTLDSNPYVGVDSGGNLHIHVNGQHYMNEEIAGEPTDDLSVESPISDDYRDSDDLKEQ